jgi:hypothetical protein
MTDTATAPVTLTRAQRSRPYARSGIPSVTTGIENLSKHMEWGSAKETALFAVHHRTVWENLDPDEAVELLRTHFRGVWDGRSAMGTLVHAINDAWCRGETVDVLDIIEDMAEDDRKAIAWRGQTEDVVAVALGFIKGLRLFWQEWRPTDNHTEEIVRLPGVFIGTSDWRTRLRDGISTRLDLKSTSQTDEAKGIYHDSFALQLTAYNRAPEIVHYDWNEKGKPFVAGTEPNERCDRLAVVHLRGDSKYELLEVDGSDDTYRQFIALLGLNNWRKNLGEPRRLTIGEDTE